MVENKGYEQYNQNMKDMGKPLFRHNNKPKRVWI